jgi:hypothetical protein
MIPDPTSRRVVTQLTPPVMIDGGGRDHGTEETTR